MNLIDRKATKLLTRSQRILAEMTGEALCERPQKGDRAQMLGEPRELLGEFEDAHFEW